MLTDEQIERFENALSTHRTIRIRRSVKMGDSISRIDTTFGGANDD